MENVANKLHLSWLLIIYLIVSISATDPESKLLENNERGGRSWHHALYGPQMVMQHQQSALIAPTSLPGDASLQQTSTHQQQPDLGGTNRNFEDLDKNNIPAASEQDFLSRHFGYLNVHRFDPNFPYNDMNVYPRFPSPHTPRFGPGYRKDKYGHGYGYSCKQGDDCDEVRAANQLTAAQPPAQFANHPHHHNPMAPFGNQYPELPAFPSVPSFPNVPSFGPYGSHFPPARFNDPHGQPMMPLPMMQPSRYYHARYLHDQEEDKKQETQQKQVDDEPVAKNN